MDYYVATFSSFGTQAALIAGFTLGALTGLDAESFSVADGWRAVFWISTAIAMASSIHCVLTTTFANIYGPNLALRGPSGFIYFLLLFLFLILISNYFYILVQWYVLLKE